MRSRIALFVGLVLAGGERDEVLLLEREVGGVVVGRQRLFEPGDAVGGHVARQLLDGGRGIAAVAHAPPGVGVHHQVEIGADGLAHQAHGFQVLLRARRGAHFVGAEAQVGDGGGFGGVGLRRHVHAGAAVEADAVADAAAEQFGNGNAAGLAGQIVEGDLHGAVDLGEFEIGAGALEEEHAEGVGVGEDAAFEEWRDGVADGAVHGLAARSRGVADQAVIGLHADEHGVALEHRSLAAVKGQPHGLRKGKGEQERSNAGDLHGTRNQNSMRPYR